MKKDEKMIPHCYSMLMVDRIVEKEHFRWVKGYKNITMNEWFIDHEIDLPSMPSVLIIEAICQLGGFVWEEKEEQIGVLAAINGVTVYGQAVPGDRLDLFFEVTKIRKELFKGRGTASVDGQLILEVQDITIFYVNHSN